MTLDEKIGQMNQYNGFWDVTGPVPNEGNAKEKYNDLANGLIGSMLNVRGAKEVRAVQNVAVNDPQFNVLQQHLSVAMSSSDPAIVADAWRAIDAARSPLACSRRQHSAPACCSYQ